MNPTTKVDTLAAARAADAAGECVAFDQHAASLAAVAVHKGDTSRTDKARGPWTDKMIEQSRLLPAEDFANLLKNSNDLERDLAAANTELDLAHTVVKQKISLLHYADEALAAANKHADTVGQSFVRLHAAVSKLIADIDVLVKSRDQHK
jgi:hypothetical protein